MITTEFETCVPAKPLLDWLRVTVTKASMRITLALNGKELTIKAGNTRATFYCLLASDFPPC